MTQRNQGRASRREARWESARDYGNLGKTLQEQGKLEAAETSYRSALQLRPDYPEAHNNLGNVLRDQGRFEESEACYRRALQLQPDYPFAHNNLGNVIQDQGRLEEAEACYRRALQLSPEFAIAHNNLGNVLSKQDRLEEAEASYLRALKLNPNDPIAHICLGNVLWAQRRLEEAETTYGRALKINPDDPRAHTSLGNFLWKQRRLGDSETCYRSALNLKPDDPIAHSNLGNILWEQGRLEEAEHSCLRALELEPDQALAHGNLANVLRDQGRLEEAEASCRRALQLQPNYPEAHNNLGNVLQDQCRFRESEVSYRRAVELAPDFATAQSNLGSALQDLGRPYDALVCHRTAIAIAPHDDVFWNGLARCLEPLTFTVVDEDLHKDLVRLLERPNIRPDLLTPPVISALRCHRHFFRILNRSLVAETEPSYAELAVELSEIPLLLQIMRLSPIYDLEVEEMLTRLRRAMVRDVLAGNVSDKSLPFSAVLALNCFVNEYVFWETPEETAAVEQLQEGIARLLRTGQDVPPAQLIALGAFRPLYEFPWSESLLDHEWPHHVEDVVAQQIREPIKERSLRNEIRLLTPIQDPVSLIVRDQYEENPYPRWIKTGGGKATTIGVALQGSPLRFDLGHYDSPASPEILIAGCGTGRHALQTASRFSNARVLAVDLSLSSLGYAIRKSGESGVSNIEYAQADILELGGLGREFDLIESSGVLHHLGDPLAGWRILLSLLRPNGLMRIALYSEIARRPIVNARSVITEKGYTTSSKDIRRLRRDFVDMDGNPEISKVFQFRDFFSLSECRDLLFHVQEHHFTLPQIEAALQSLNLRFLGFEFLTQGPSREFTKSHPEQGALTSLALWHKFELENPNTFAGMYQFWCRKI